MLLLRSRPSRAQHAKEDRRFQKRLAKMIANADFVSAINLVSEYLESNEDPALERQLVELRHRAFPSLQGHTAPDWPPPHDDRFAGLPGIPEIDAPLLDVDALRAGVLGKGSLLVRGLLTAEMVTSLTEAVNEAFLRYDTSDHCLEPPDNDPWLSPWRFGPKKRDGRPTRDWTRRASGVLAADSPRALRRLQDVLEQTGTIELATRYFEEPPALSVLKTTLRKVTPTGELSYGWHQDGAFLGADVRSLNLWIALSPCGENAPSLQMVPQRIHEVIGSGGEGAVFSWSVSGQQVLEASGPEGPQWLSFEAGDVIFFDHLNLHSTAMTPEMTEERLAIEAWMFAASHFPLDRIPLVL